MNIQKQTVIDVKMVISSVKPDISIMDSPESENTLVVEDVVEVFIGEDAKVSVCALDDEGEALSAQIKAALLSNVLTKNNFEELD